jgi:hypothetical protein
MSNLLIELLSAADSSYFEFFPGDKFIGGIGLAIYWTVKNGAGFSDG